MVGFASGPRRRICGVLEPLWGLPAPRLLPVVLRLREPSNVDLDEVDDGEPFETSPKRLCADGGTVLRSRGSADALPGDTAEFGVSPVRALRLALVPEPEPGS